MVRGITLLYLSRNCNSRVLSRFPISRSIQPIAFRIKSCLCALLMMVERFKKSGGEEREAIYRFYLSQTERINNWDLVDLSAPYIVGEYLKDKSRDDLYRLAESTLLWDQRIAVVSTVTFIRNNDFIDILRLSELLLQHKRHSCHSDCKSSAITSKGAFLYFFATSRVAGTTITRNRSPSPYCPLPVLKNPGRYSLFICRRRSA